MIPIKAKEPDKADNAWIETVEGVMVVTMDIHP